MNLANVASWNLRKATDKVLVVGTDDRLTGNRKAVADELLGNLEYAIEVCQALIEALAEGGDLDG